jgi:L-seryl-tRNA(Ser) seleniumtransferase
MITSSLETLKKQANNLAVQLRDSLASEFKIKVKKGHSQVGGGAFPLEKLPTYVIELSTDKFAIDKLAQKLRLNNPPIFTRIYNDAIIFDLRTLKEEEFSHLVEAIKSID